MKIEITPEQRDAYAELLVAAIRYMDFRHTSDIGQGEGYSGIHPETELKNAIGKVRVTCCEKHGGNYMPGFSCGECATEKEKGESALDVQIGGGHYKSMAIQPMEYSMKNGLDACQHTAIKYISRFRDKGGIEDLKKAKHCIDMLIEFEQAKTK